MSLVRPKATYAQVQACIASCLDVEWLSDTPKEPFVYQDISRPLVGYYNPMLMPYISICTDARYLDPAALQPSILLMSAVQGSDQYPGVFTGTFASPTEAACSNLRRQLRHLRPYQTVHGTLVSINGIGLLITGKPGIGKSRLALSLVDKGHALVADDAPQLVLGSDRWYGRCPAQMLGQMHVRFLGFLNIKTRYGINAMRQQISLDGIVHLSKAKNCDVNQILMPQSTAKMLTPFAVKQWILPVEMGHDLVMLVENVAHLIEHEKQKAAENITLLGA